MKSCRLSFLALHSSGSPSDKIQLNACIELFSLYFFFVQCQQPLIQTTSSSKTHFLRGVCVCGRNWVTALQFTNGNTSDSSLVNKSSAFPIISNSNLHKQAILPRRLTSSEITECHSAPLQSRKNALVKTWDCQNLLQQRSPLGQGRHLIEMIKASKEAGSSKEKKHPLYLF